MRLSQSDSSDYEEPNEASGLLIGVTPYLIRLLCQAGEFGGGYNYKPRDVGELTHDQFFMLLADKKFLRKHSKHGRVERMDKDTITNVMREDGSIVGRDEEGNIIKQTKFTGESLAQRLWRELEEKKTKPKEKKTKPKSAWQSRAEKRAARRKRREERRKQRGD